MTDLSDLAVAQKRLNNRLLQDELQRMAQERAQEETRRLAARHAEAVREADVHAEVVANLAKLRVDYEKRQTAFEVLYAALSDFLAIENKLKGARERELRRLSGHPQERLERAARLCREAGIPFNHADLAGCDKISRTVAIGLISGIIREGAVVFENGQLLISV